MKPLLNLFLKVFLQVVVVYTILLFGFMLFQQFEISLLQYIIMSIAVGVPLAVLFVSMQVDNLRRLGVKEMTADNLDVKHSRKVWSPLTKKEIKAQLKKKRRFSNAKYEVTDKGLELKTRSLWFYWGEKIQITLINASEEQFEYKVSSKPVLSFIFLDYGRNLKNIQLITNLIGEGAP